MAEQTATLLVHHRVADFDTWKAGFDDHEDVRRAHGFLAHRLNVGADDPNDVRVYLAISDLEKAREFAASDELREIMQEVGVISPPHFTWATPARFDIVWEGVHPAFILRHRVRDFDRWLLGYDDADEFRREMGIIGHAANRSIDDPHLAIVYHQAETFDDLHAFLDEPELKEIMAAAGVISDPEVVFVRGGWAKRY